jgi:hypothetical protein
MADVQQNRDFAAVLLVQWPLDDAIEWIRKHMDPEDVFEPETLTCWANDNCEPGDVFTERALVTWAEENGYVKCDGR